jgi:hypothetical protein
MSHVCFIILRKACMRNMENQQKWLFGFLLRRFVTVQQLLFSHGLPVSMFEFMLGEDVKLVPFLFSPALNSSIWGGIRLGCQDLTLCHQHWQCWASRRELHIVIITGNSNSRRYMYDLDCLLNLAMHHPSPVTLFLLFHTNGWGCLLSLLSSACDGGSAGFSTWIYTRS